MFGSALFKEHAIRLNALEYVNTINLNNRDIPADAVTIIDGAATVPWTRHPYEWPMNEAYISFLKSGLLDRSTPFGRFITLETAVAPKPRAEDGYSPQYILDQLVQFYDIHHAALQNNVLLNSLPPTQILSVPRPTFTIRILMFTMNRFTSFERLWQSVATAHAISVPISIDIFVDYDDGDSLEGRERFQKALHRLVDNTVNTTVHFAPKKMGLKRSILKAWAPASNYEYAIMLVCAV